MGAAAESFGTNGGFKPEETKGVPLQAEKTPLLLGKPIFDPKMSQLPQGGCHLRLVTGKDPQGKIPVQTCGSGAQKPSKPPVAPPVAPVAPEEAEEMPPLGTTHIEDITKASQARVEQIIASLTGGAKKIEQSAQDEVNKIAEILKTFVQQFQVEKSSPRIVELEAENKKLWEMFLALTDEVKKLRQENAKLKGTA